MLPQEPHVRGSALAAGDHVDDDLLRAGAKCNICFG